jgi:hypothetical protein
LFKAFIGSSLDSECCSAAAAKATLGQQCLRDDVGSSEFLPTCKQTRAASILLQCLAEAETSDAEPTGSKVDPGSVIGLVSLLL